MREFTLRVQQRGANGNGCVLEHQVPQGVGARFRPATSRMTENLGCTRGFSNQGNMSAKSALPLPEQRREMSAAEPACSGWIKIYEAVLSRLERHR